MTNNRKEKTPTINYGHHGYTENGKLTEQTRMAQEAANRILNNPSRRPPSPIPKRRDPKHKKMN